MIWSPSTIVAGCVDGEAAVGVAVERHPASASEATTTACSCSGWVEPHSSLMLRPSG